MFEVIMQEGFVQSTRKLPGRRIWSLLPRYGRAAVQLVFLDAELYIERVGAPQVLHQLEEQGLIPAVAAVFVSNVSAAARHVDYVCDTDYAYFLAHDLLPAIVSTQTIGRVILIGLSLSGLAAAHAAVTTGLFHVAICQSPSFWWAEERFTSTLSPASKHAPALWISVGDQETTAGVAHPPTGLLQMSSQHDSCERGAAALREAGYTIAYRLFEGGHDPACWRDDLALALPWVLSV
jgi:enterochelin esterase-like enzyme